MATAVVGIGTGSQVVEQEQTPVLKRANAVAVSRAAQVGSTVLITMLENTRAALRQHREREAEGDSIKNSVSVYASEIAAVPTIEQILTSKIAEGCEFSEGAHAEQGFRKTMEDTHFSVRTPLGIFRGVFDGHGGSEVAEDAKRAFETRFAAHVEKNCDTMIQAFQSFVDEFQAQIAKKKEWTPKNSQGCTMVVSFFDTKAGLVYTGTLGDAMAVICREERGELKLIPLSGVQDWREDAARAAVLLGRPSIAQEWKKAPEPKNLRVGGAVTSINVNQALGGCGLWVDKPGGQRMQIVTQKVVVTVNRLLPNDIAVHACDGLPDYMKLRAMVKEISVHKEAPCAAIARRLVTCALDTVRELRKTNPRHPGDNVTVDVMKFSPTTGRMRTWCVIS